MAIENAQLIDPDKGIFSILDSILIRLSGPYLWCGEDIDENNCKGSIFRLYDESKGLDIAYIMIVDASNDPTEPDVSLLDEEVLYDVDQYLCDDITTGLKNRGMEMVEWMSSHLNKFNGLNALVTAYKILDQGKERQEVHIRMGSNGRKWVLISCFDIARKDELAEPIINTLMHARIVEQNFHKSDLQ